MRVREAVAKDAGQGKEDLETLGQREDCLTEHPGKSCRWLRNGFVGLEEENERDEGEEEEEERSESDEHPSLHTDDEAYISETWDDGSESSGGHCSESYWELWDKEEQRYAVLHHAQEEIDKVEEAEKKVKALESNGSKKMPMGDLRGHWAFYNIEFRSMQKFHDTRYDMRVNDSAWQVLSGQEEDSGEHDPIACQIAAFYGDMGLFKLPEHASSKSIPINWELGVSKRYEGTLKLLGGRFLKIQIPRRLVAMTQKQKDGSEYVEFAGVRWTDEQEEQLKSNMRKRANPPSPKDSVFYRMNPHLI